MNKDLQNLQADSDKLLKLTKNNPE